MIDVKGSGPLDARVLIIGDFPDVESERRGEPFAGGAGEELTKMLHEAGFLFTDLRCTYLHKSRPYASQAKYAFTTVKKEASANGLSCFANGAYYSPAMGEYITRLVAEINELNPTLIITLGDAPLWALTGELGINKWRGSMLTASHPGLSRPFKLIPTLTPALILRVWEWRPFVVRDLQRAFPERLTGTYKVPEYRLTIRPSYPEAMSRLQWLLSAVASAPEPFPITCDIETIARHISCVGFAWSATDAICIPIMDTSESYWPPEQEYQLILRIRELLTHPNALIIGQNFAYDSQHFIRHWGFRPRIDSDTMLEQHTCFPGIPKDLGFLASMYCAHYVYWKDELQDYHSMPTDVTTYWLYNAKDCVNTWEIHQSLRAVVDHLHFTPQRDFLLRLNRHVISMMVRGVRIDRKVKDRLSLELLQVLAERQDAINFLVGSPINISSPKQMKELLYGEMGFKPILDKKTKQPTTNDGALKEIATREPILRPLMDLISETRSIGVFLSTFVNMPLDKDGRMRCSFNVGGTETYRFSSSKDAFGSGGNLQNIPKGDEEKTHDPHSFVLPNIRKLFIPDPGMTLFDVDLAGADAQVVAWEAHDDDLKAKFRSGQKIHALNAKDLYGSDAGPDGKRQPYYGKAKMGCHLTNYGGKARTLSKGLGMTMHEAETFQTRWFAMHPGIKVWHQEVENSLYTTRSVSNKFGFRRFYFDRMENLLPQALAWIPQSTVALVINHALCKISESGTALELLLQVHDSLVGQFPTELLQSLIPILYECLKVTIPYDDPLTIGTSLDLSLKSWGDLEGKKWTDFPGVII